MKPPKRGGPKRAPTGKKTLFNKVMHFLLQGFVLNRGTRITSTAELTQLVSQSLLKKARASVDEPGVRRGTNGGFTILIGGQTM